VIKGAKKISREATPGEGGNYAQPPCPGRGKTRIDPGEKQPRHRLEKTKGEKRGKCKGARTYKKKRAILSRKGECTERQNTSQQTEKKAGGGKG